MQTIARLEYIRAVLVEQGKGGALCIPDLAPLLEADADTDADSSVPDGPVNQDALDRVGLHAARFLERLMLRVSNSTDFVAFLDTVVAQGYPPGARVGSGPRTVARVGTCSREQAKVALDSLPDGRALAGVVPCVCLPITYKQDLLPLLQQIADVFEIEIESLAVDKPRKQSPFAPAVAPARPASAVGREPARAPKAGSEGPADAAKPPSKARTSLPTSLAHDRMTSPAVWSDAHTCFPPHSVERVHKETNRAGFAVAKPIPRPGSPTPSTSSAGTLPPQKRPLGRSQMRVRGPMRALAPSAAPSKASAAPSILVMETPVAKPNKRKQLSDGAGSATRPDRDSAASRLRRKLF